MRNLIRNLKSYWLADASFVTLLVMLVMLVTAVFVLPVVMEGSGRGVTLFNVHLLSIANTLVFIVINFRLLFRDQIVNACRIVGAINIYLLLALMGALSLEVIHAVTGSSLGGNVVLTGTDGDYVHFIYFSLVSLTTVGFGDLYAVSTPARMLATALSTLGVMFPAIVIARLVGLAASRS